MSQIPVKNVTPEPELQSMYKKREKIYVRAISGVFQKIRSWSLWALMLGYFGTAWLNWGDRQAILFDLPERKFHILGMTFWPQDFVLLSSILIICAFGQKVMPEQIGRASCRERV